MTTNTITTVREVAELVLSLQQLEGWYRCEHAECGHGFWRDLSPKATCPTPDCRQRCPPLSEVVGSDGAVTSTFRCMCCRVEWQQRFALAKPCNKCERRAMPADVRTARGAGHARCPQCNRVSYDLDTTMGASIVCRNCRASARATSMCSQRRRRNVDELMRKYGISLDVMPLFQQSSYVASTQRTRHAHCLERTCAPALSSPLVSSVNRLVVVSPT